jgi:hypothetical protein
MQKLCREDVDPLGTLFRGAARTRGPKVKTLAGPLNRQVKESDWGLCSWPGTWPVGGSGS